VVRGQVTELKQAKSRADDMEEELAIARAMVASLEEQVMSA
jgi:hypothetical protein